MPDLPASPRLARLGCTADRAIAPTDPTLGLGRVITQGRGGWTVALEDGDILADLLGRFRHDTDRDQLPAVGDWVLVAPRPTERRGTIHVVLPRTSALMRKVAGVTTQSQTVAANVDIVLVTVPFSNELRVRLVERQLSTVWESGATPVVLMTKADRASTSALDDALERLRSVAVGVDVIALSAASGHGVDLLGPWLLAGRTVVLLGPSGAGKSTLANRLLGHEHLATGDVRDSDGKGRHTTSHRELIELPGGALLIDTPGLRELALWDADEGVETTFADIDEIGAACRFSDCAHSGEPGCAVEAAVADGSLDAGRVVSWRKLQRELAHLARQQDALARQQERKRWAAINREARGRSRP